MTTTSGGIGVQAVAREIIDVIQAGDGDFDVFAEAASAACVPLLDRQDLLHIGLPRQGNHADDSSWLYWDGDLSIAISHIPMGIPIPIHDHGVWQLLGIWNGSIDHRLYERRHDGGHGRSTQIQEIDRRVLEVGDVFPMPAPPRDIHGFMSPGPDTYLLTVVPGDYDPIRRYFDVDRQTFIERHQLSWGRTRTQ